jgi:hypothetical protein
MIRLFGFLTGVAVTGIALLLFTDERALESAHQALEQVSARFDAGAPLRPEARTVAGTPRPAAVRTGHDEAGDGLTAARTDTGLDAPDVPAPVSAPVATADMASSADLSAAPAPANADPDAAASRPARAAAAEPVADPDSSSGLTTAGAAAFGSPDLAVPEDLATATPAAPAAAASGETTMPVDAAGAGQWQAFWRPFRSHASAQGFATHLGSATGQEIRVLRMGPGAYRVAFFHTGDDERRQQLVLLEQASGLTLGGEL